MVTCEAPGRRKMKNNPEKCTSTTQARQDTPEKTNTTEVSSHTKIKKHIKNTPPRIRMSKNKELEVHIPRT